MSILQDPISALAQAEWYLDRSDQELFPGAFEIAAGNVCRQTLEQALLIACFFSGMPRARFVKSDSQLRTAGRLLDELKKKDPVTGHSYWVMAGRRGSRVRKITRRRNELQKYARLLNEPSHFSLRYRSVGSLVLRRFIQLGRSLFNEQDKHLLVALLNDVLSLGRFAATMGPEPENTPGIMQTFVVTAHNLERTPDGRLGLTTPEQGFVVAPLGKIPSGPWPRVPVLVEHSVGISIGAQLTTKRGRPINCSSLGTLLTSLASTRGERAYLSRRMRQLGFEIDFAKPKQGA
jgi:hypothetical protein